MNIILSYFILMVLAAVAALLSVAIARLGGQRRHYDRQLQATSKTVAQLIVRVTELRQLLVTGGVRR